MDAIIHWEYLFFFGGGWVGVHAILVIIVDLTILMIVDYCLLVIITEYYRLSLFVIAYY